VTAIYLGCDEDAVAYMAGVAFGCWYCLDMFWVNKQDLYIWSMVFAGLAIVCALPLYRIRQPWLVYACICMTSLFAACP
jgi:hypothetical protein